MQLAACVANFSEGRDPDVLRAIEDAAESVHGVTLLDIHVDADHHRSVLTFAGALDRVSEAAFRATREAARRIDLTRHRGVHPRMGAADVVPFVPVGATPLEDCVRAARETGARIARELDIPVFLYEAAAEVAARRSLVDVRRGEFEGLAKRFADGERPDYGPAAPHPSAGAVAVGARMPLVAFNVDLDTDDLDAAKAIARAVRESGGGRPAVRALGVALPERGVVQVTMNLVDYRATPPHVAYREVVRLAEARGIRVLGSEVVGLLPVEALLPAIEEGLGLKVAADRVLEVSLMRRWIEDARQPPGPP